MDQEQADKAVKNAWMAGIVSGTLTLIVTIAAMAGYGILGFSALNLLDVAVIGGLTFGIYRKSRACAVIMLIYFIGSKLLLWTETRSLSGLPMALVFGWYFYQGVSGAFAWHGLNPDAGRPAPQTSIPGAVPKFATREEYQAWKEQRGQGANPSPAIGAATSAGQSAGVPVWVWAAIIITIGAAVLVSASGMNPFSPSEAAWREFSSTDGNFSVLMPGAPTYDKKTTTTAMGPIDMHMFTIETRQSAHIVMYSDYPEAITNAPAEKVLDSGRDGAVANTKGKLLSEQNISLDGFPGREFTIEIPGKGLMKLRAFLVRQRLFQVMAVGTKDTIDHEDTAAYLTSFRLPVR